METSRVERYKAQEQLLVDYLAGRTRSDDQLADPNADDALRTCMLAEKAMSQWRLVEAAKHYARAMQLDPQSPIARSGYAYLAYNKAEAGPKLDDLVREWSEIQSPYLRRSRVRSLDRNPA